MNYRKLITALILCVLIIIPQTGCGKEETVTDNCFCLDTVCTITIYDQNQKTGEKLIDEAFDTCFRYENMLSRTVKGSDVYNINNAGGKPVEVSDETIEVIEKGITFGELSGGRFDITIGAVSELWDFNSENPSVPDEAMIQKALPTVNYRQIKIDGNKVSLENPDAKIDLGGIAKGYIADKIAAQLIEAGVTSAVIDLGGNIVTIGSKTDGSPWRIGIERPYSDRSDVIGVVSTVDETITTSGVYERCFESGGKMYHHVLDPATGYPMETGLDAVTVKAPCGYSAECDAFGTMFLMMGEEDSRKVLEQYPDIQAAFIDKNDNITAVNGMVIEPVE